jgi:hypothetical protein
MHLTTQGTDIRQGHCRARQSVLGYERRHLCIVGTITTFVMLSSMYMVQSFRKHPIFFMTCRHGSFDTTVYLISSSLGFFSLAPSCLFLVVLSYIHKFTCAGALYLSLLRRCPFFLCHVPPGEHVFVYCLGYLSLWGFCLRVAENIVAEIFGVIAGSNRRHQRCKTDVVPCFTLLLVCPYAGLSLWDSSCN